MSFADPQSVTIDAVPISLPRTSVGVNKSEYTSADGLVKLSSSSNYGRRTRRVLRLDHSKVTADPYIPANNIKVSMSCYIVFDVPALNVGYTTANQLAVYDGLRDQAAIGPDTLITKLLAGES